VAADVLLLDAASAAIATAVPSSAAAAAHLRLCISRSSRISFVSVF
jgi:hypothetical protein